jgi:hypothetical protein
MRTWLILRLIRAVRLVRLQVFHVKSSLIAVSVMVKAVSQASDVVQAKALIREQANLRVVKSHAAVTQASN